MKNLILKYIKKFNETNTKGTNENKQPTSVMTQILIISVITLISKYIESSLPFPMPSSVIGLVLLFIALCTGVIKLRNVEKVGTALTDNISLLFVPSGISVINSLGILAENPVLILSLIIISTVLLLAVTGKFTELIINFNAKSIIGKTKGLLSEIDVNANAEGRI